MEVAKLNTYIVATPEPHIGGMYWIFLSIETKCGILGVGEVYSASFHPEVVVKASKMCLKDISKTMTLTTLNVSIESVSRVVLRRGLI